MTELQRFLAVLSEIAPYLPPAHGLVRVDGARRVSLGEDLQAVSTATGVAPDLIRRTARALETGQLSAITGKVPAGPDEIAAQRFRVAQLLLGALTEERFEREKQELTAGRLMVEDHRLGRTDTDYRVLNGGGKPIFRINIKFHGSAFQQARVHVGLDSDDCFALATYKIHQALARQRDESLPYVFLVLSALGVTARSVSDLISEEYAWFVCVSKKFRKRDIEEAVVARLLTGAFTDVLAEIRRKIAAAEFRVISASRAEKLMKDKLFERVFALRQRAFTSAFRNAEIDMHFSLTREMVPVREFLATVASESPQRLAVLLYQGEVV